MEHSAHLSKNIWHPVRIYAGRLPTFFRHTLLKPYSFPRFIKVIQGNIYFPLGLIILCIWILFIIVTHLSQLQEWTSRWIPPTVFSKTTITDSIISEKELSDRESEIAKLQKELYKYTPRSGYLVVNTSANKFRLYAGGQLIREGICSTGSYTLLTDGKEKKWYFKTPKGIFRIRDKKTNPVWKKPDWAFVEEGLPVPPANHPSRFEYGTLGDYALSLGDGYLIHGTLYQRFLGMPVTHGCIRLGDEDLKEVYKTLKIGAYVFIY